MSLHDKIKNDKSIDRSVLDELTPSQRTRLVKLCGQVSIRAGYCDEFVRIMNLMGFVIPDGFIKAEELAKYRDPKDKS